MYTSVFVSDGIGLVLMIMLLITNKEHFSKEARTKNLLIMIIITILSCISDIVTFGVEGKTGTVINIINYIMTSWLYLASMLVSYFWAMLECDFIGVKITKAENFILKAMRDVGLILIIVNIFYPVVFSLDNNVYKREGVYWIYVAIGIVNILYGHFVYFRAKKKGKLIIPFPLYPFTIPMVTAIIIQSVLYGVSLIWVGVAIAIVAVSSSIKNTLIFIDSLTHVYNQYYLQKISSDYADNEEISFTGIMLDVNDFKKINDTYGHEVGDEALIATASAFSHAVNGCGSVIRSGGDEFLIIIDSTDEKQVKSVITDIETELDRYNKANSRDYYISISKGVKKYDGKCDNFSKYLTELDKLMYLDKMEYHRTHDSEDDSEVVKLGAFIITPDILEKAHIGLWAFEIDDGQETRMFVDDTMLNLMGNEHLMTPEQTYKAWYGSIDEGSYSIVEKGIEKMSSGEYAEVQCPYHYPNGTIQVVRFGGMRNFDYKKGIRLEGTYQNVSDVLSFGN